MPSPAHMPSAEVEDIAAYLDATGVPRSARILDAPCGIGKRAFALAERGYRVTAVDPNEIAIGALQARVPAELSQRLEYRHAARETLPGPPVSDAFDVLLCLDHALGRGSREDDVALLERLRGHLSLGGLLLVELLHRDFFAARPRPFAYHVIGDLEQHEFRSFDPLTGVLGLTWKFYQRDGEDLRFRGSSSAKLQLVTPNGVRRLLGEAGWRLEAVHGGWNREAVSSDRRKLVFVARPAARG